MAVRAPPRRRRDASLGQIPLSSGEIELYSRQDEATRRRRRLLAVRDQERRLAQQVTQRYRQNLQRLQRGKSDRTHKQLSAQQHKMLTELHARYQSSLQSMGAAQRNARLKLLELMETAHDERHKWAFNAQVTGKQRLHEAQEVREEEEKKRTERRRQVEQNVERLKVLTGQQRRQASARARHEQQLAEQRAKDREEIERLRREQSPEEVFVTPRPKGKDVQAYRLTRTHCVVPSVEVEKQRPAVTVIRHNRRHSTALHGEQEADKYREEVGRRRERDRLVVEEQQETAADRGKAALGNVTSRQQGQQALEWLALVDKMERRARGMEFGGEEDVAFNIGDAGGVPDDPDMMAERAFARLLGLDEDSVELSAFSIDTEDDRSVGLDDTDHEHSDGDTLSRLDQVASDRAKSLEQRFIDQHMLSVSPSEGQSADEGCGDTNITSNDAHPSVNVNPYHPYRQQIDHQARRSSTSAGDSQTLEKYDVQLVAPNVSRKLTADQRNSFDRSRQRPARQDPQAAATENSRYQNKPRGVDASAVSLRSEKKVLSFLRRPSISSSSDSFHDEMGAKSVDTSVEVPRARDQPDTRRDSVVHQVRESRKSSLADGSAADDRSDISSESGVSSLGFVVQLNLAAGISRKRNDDGEVPSHSSRQQRSAASENEQDDQSNVSERSFASSSSLSMDANINSLAEMTSAVDNSSPLRLRLPAMMYGKKDMTTPPAPIARSASSVSSVANASGADRNEVFNLHHQARRSSTYAVSIAQYSLPPSDTQTSFDDSLHPGYGDDSFVNELVPMFPKGVQPPPSQSLEGDSQALEEYDVQLVAPNMSRKLTADQRSSFGRSREHPARQDPRAVATESSRNQVTSKGVRVSAVSTRSEQKVLFSRRPSLSSSSDSFDYEMDAENMDTSAEEPRVRHQADTGRDSGARQERGSRKHNLADDSAADDRSVVSSDSGVGLMVQLDLAAGIPRNRNGDGEVPSYSTPPQRSAASQDEQNDQSNVSERSFASSSSLSMDAHLNYLAKMTSAVGMSLPLHLRLPAMMYGKKDMTKPPAPIAWSASSVSSVASASVADRNEELERLSQSDRRSVSSSSSSISEQEQEQELQREPERKPAPIRDATEQKPNFSDNSGVDDRSDISSESGVSSLGFAVQLNLAAGISRKRNDDGELPSHSSRQQRSAASENEQDDQSNMSERSFASSSSLSMDANINSLAEMTSAVDNSLPLHLRLPAMMHGKKDMTKPPAPIAWSASSVSSVANASVADPEVGRLPHSDRSSMSSSSSSMSESLLDEQHNSASVGRNLDDNVRVNHSDQSKASNESSEGKELSLAEAFRRRHPGFGRRAESHREKLKRQRDKQQEQEQGQELQQQREHERKPAPRRGTTDVQDSRSRGDTDPLPPEKQQLLDRLASGSRAKISSREMKERSRRLYHQLPEVVERKRQEEVMRRRRERLNELREQEKERRLQQKQRRQQQQQHQHR